MSNRTTHRLSAGLAATALVALSLPLAAAPAPAAPPGMAPSTLAAPTFGYSTAAWGTPVHIEIYEPTIPIPATPQAELENGYTEVLADSSSSQGRSSYLWPGDPVGEGFKTIADQLGLPEEIGAQGYPFQVNAAYPSGPESQADEPGPAMIQRASAGEGTARAVNGFSGDGEAQEPGDGSGGGGGTPQPPGPPQLPGLPTPGASGTGSGGLGGFGRGIVAYAADGDGTDAETAGPALPPELTALVDVGSFSSVSSTDNTRIATATSRSAVGDVSVLGGLLTFTSIGSAAGASSDGTRGAAVGGSEFGDVLAFGQKLKVTRAGLTLVGRSAPIPGLPDDATQALAALGVKVTAPRPTREIDGDAATTEVPGLVLEFDLTKLRTMIQDVPINDIVNQIPDETGQLKSLIQAAANLSPRIVVTLGTAAASVDTSPPIEIPDVSLPDGPAAPAGSSGTGSAGGSPQAATPPGAGVPSGAGAPDAGAAQDAAGTLFPTSGEQAPGLPKLFSIPGMLMLGALLLAAMGGNVMRRLGVAALGGGAACSHGLDSGLPDLRKVN